MLSNPTITPFWRQLRQPSRWYAAGASVCLLCGVLLIGCTAVPEKRADSINPRWPPPPEPVRYAYLTTLRSNADLVSAEDRGLRELISGEMQRREVFGKPAGITAADGMIFVTDTRLRLVHVFDIPRRRYFRFGYRLQGALGKPLGIALDEGQLVYVADVQNRRVAVFDRLGLFQRYIGTSQELTRPTAVAVSADGQRVYVVDTGGVDSERHRLLVYNGGGELLSVIGRRGSGAGEFNLPVDIVLGKDGELYVLDSGNFRIQVFDSEGRYLREWGGVGNGFGQFARPKAITSDKEGNLYVADAAFGNVQVFNPSGRLLLSIGRSGEEDRPGRYAIPAGLAFDEMGHLYVLDQIFRKIDVIRKVE